ncbi:MAG: DUF2735 domain-containing protein [Hyphomicrobium sp.]|nr:DUF2735 domain-containing protein [Hyphomicrobium sp.]
MTPKLLPNSTNVFEFPARGRSTRPAALPLDNTSAAVTQIHVAMTACGESWYHEAAIIDAKHKPQRS